MTASYCELESPDTDIPLDIRVVDIGVGSLLNDRYLLEEMIGEGGMARVFKALDLRRDEVHDPNPYVAIKLLNDRVRSMRGAAIALQREAMVAQSLMHMGVTKVYDYNREKQHPYIVMEWVEGPTLDQLIIESYPHGLPRSQAFLLIQGLMQSIEYAHKKGVVHADIKPSNIKVLPTGLPILMDFGLARVVSVMNVGKAENGHSSSNLLDSALNEAVTPSYATQSRLRGADPSEADDIYAVGCVIYMILTGCHPYKRNDIEEGVRAEKRLLPQRPVGLSFAQWSILKSAMNPSIGPSINNASHLISELSFHFSVKYRPERTKKKAVYCCLIGLFLAASSPAILSWFQEDFQIWRIRYAETPERIPLLSALTKQGDSEKVKGNVDSLERIFLPHLLDSEQQKWGSNKYSSLIDQSLDDIDFDSFDENSLLILMNDIAIANELSSLLSGNPPFMDYYLRLEKLRTQFVAGVLDHYDSSLTDYINDPHSTISDLLRLVVRDYEWLKATGGPIDVIQNDPRLHYLFSEEIEQAWRSRRYEALSKSTQAALVVFPEDSYFLMILDKLHLKLRSPDVPVDHLSSANAPAIDSELMPDRGSEFIRSSSPLPVNQAVLISVLSTLMFASSNNFDLNPNDRDRYIALKRRYLNHYRSEGGWEKIERVAYLDYANALFDMGRTKEAYAVVKEMAQH